MASTLPITGIIHTKNSADTVGDAIRSLDFCSEILVADMLSDDATTAIAKSMGATIIGVPDKQYVEAVRQQVIDQANQEWIFILDADEEVSAGLKQEISKLVQASTATALKIPRKNLIFGAWLQHTGWWPDYQVRLFKRGTLNWPATIHSQPVVSGKIEEVPATADTAIIHHNYSSVSEFVARMNRYTDIESQTKTENAVEDLLPIMLESFCDRAIHQRGVEDGEPGLVAAFLQAFYPSLVAAKSWEKDNGEHKRTQDIDVDRLFESLKRTEKTIRYWNDSLHIDHSHGITKLYWKIKRKWRL